MQGTDVAKKNISIIIVTFQNQETIDSCLSSIARRMTTDYEIVIVDNSPAPHTLNHIDGFRKTHPRIPLIVLSPGKNLGFAKGCNLGAENAGGRYLLFLNPDTVLENDVCRILGSVLEADPGIGVAGPLILDTAGRITKTCRNFPSVFNIFMDSMGLDRVLGIYRLLHFSHTYEKKVDQVIGACFFVSKKHFTALNGFDERFFVYFEEVDFCKRSIDLGYGVVFCPDARIQHLAGVSCEDKTVASRMIGQLRKSRLLYFQKHFSYRHFFLMGLINRLEGIFKGVVFGVLSIFKPNRSYGEKAKGYLKVGLWG